MLNEWIKTFASSNFCQQFKIIISNVILFRIEWLLRVEYDREKRIHSQERDTKIPKLVWSTEAKLKLEWEHMKSYFDYGTCQWEKTSCRNLSIYSTARFRFELNELSQTMRGTSIKISNQPYHTKTKRNKIYLNLENTLIEYCDSLI